MYLSVSVYGLEACPLNKSELYSLDFVVSRLFMKHFNTSDISFVKRCQDRFNFAHCPALHSSVVARSSWLQIFLCSVYVAQGLRVYRGYRCHIHIDMVSTLYYFVYCSIITLVVVLALT